MVHCIHFIKRKSFVGLIKQVVCF